MLIGYMHYRKRPHGLNKAYAFAAVAEAEGARLLFFSPGAVDFENRIIKGYIYKNGRWKRTNSRFPDVILNVAAFSGERQIEAAERLEKEIPFTDHAIGDKLSVFKNLSKYGELAESLIPTEELLSVRHFFKLLERYKEVVLKPSSGCQGIGVYHIRREDAADYKKLSEFVAGKLAGETCLVQPYINCRTKAGAPYDFRLHTQKNGEGGRVITRIYPRVSVKGGIVCNLSGGGYTAGLKDFMSTEFGADAAAVTASVERFALRLAGIMDEIQMKLYGEELDELGIDIGLDENRKIRLYEVNWRPGTPPSWYIELNTVTNKIRYAMYLASREKGEA